MKLWGMLILLNEVENFAELLFSGSSVSDFSRDALHNICQNSMESKGQAGGLQLDSCWLLILENAVCLGSRIPVFKT